MNQLSALAQKDARIVYRDRFMLFIALYALVIAIACRSSSRGFPWPS